MRANSLSYLYHLSPRPPPDFNFFHCYEKKKDFLAISTAVSLLMSPGGIVFSVQCDEPVLRGHSAMWWVTSFAYVSFPPFPFLPGVCTALGLQWILLSLLWSFLTIKMVGFDPGFETCPVIFTYKVSVFFKIFPCRLWLVFRKLFYLCAAEDGPF